MSGLLQPTWYVRFRREMEAIGCEFGSMTIDDEDIKVPLNKMDEARAIILKYSDRAQRKKWDTFDAVNDTVRKKKP
jgi:hypothetical protein